MTEPVAASAVPLPPPAVRLPCLVQLWIPYNLQLLLTQASGIGQIRISISPSPSLSDIDSRSSMGAVESWLVSSPTVTLYYAAVVPVFDENGYLIALLSAFSGPSVSMVGVIWK